jgi:hypothetical protein
VQSSESHDVQSTNQSADSTVVARQAQHPGGLGELSQGTINETSAEAKMSALALLEAFAIRQTEYRTSPQTEVQPLRSAPGWITLFEGICTTVKRLETVARLKIDGGPAAQMSTGARRVAMQAKVTLRSRARF